MRFHMKFSRFSFRAGLGVALIGMVLSGSATAAVVINSPGFTGESTTMDNYYQVFSPATSAHSLTSLTITSFAALATVVPSNHTYSVTFYADSAGLPGTALTSAISSSSVSGLLSAAPTMSSPPWFRFEVTFDLSASPVSIGAGETFWYSLTSSRTGQNLFIGPSTADYGNDWGTGRVRTFALAGATNRTPGIILNADVVTAPVSGPGIATAVLVLGAAWARRRARVTRS